jgi:hypothetical protein
VNNGLFPNADSQYALGGASLCWKELHADQVYTDQVGPAADADLLGLASGAFTVRGISYFTSQAAAGDSGYAAYFRRQNYGAGLLYIGFQAHASYYSFLAVGTDASLQFSIYDGTWHNPLKMVGSDVVVQGDLQVNGGDIGLAVDADLIGLAANMLTVRGAISATLKSGTTQAAAGAAAGELWVDTDDAYTVKMGV